MSRDRRGDGVQVVGGSNPPCPTNPPFLPHCTSSLFAHTSMHTSAGCGRALGSSACWNTRRDRGFCSRAAGGEEQEARGAIRVTATG
jgi:hypothetical protein